MKKIWLFRRKEKIMENNNNYNSNDNRTNIGNADDVKINDRISSFDQSFSELSRQYQAVRELLVRNKNNGEELNYWKRKYDESQKEVKASDVMEAILSDLTELFNDIENLDSLEEIKRNARVRKKTIISNLRAAQVKLIDFKVDSELNDNYNYLAVHRVKTADRSLNNKIKTVDKMGCRIREEEVILPEVTVYEYDPSLAKRQGYDNNVPSQSFNNNDPAQFFDNNVSDRNDNSFGKGGEFKSSYSIVYWSFERKEYMPFFNANELQLDTQTFRPGKSDFRYLQQEAFWGNKVRFGIKDAEGKNLIAEYSYQLSSDYPYLWCIDCKNENILKLATFEVGSWGKLHFKLVDQIDLSKNKNN